MIFQQDNYRKAIVFEKTGEYSKAESLYVDLYSDNPDNFNYFIRMGCNDLFDGPVPFDKKCSGFKATFFCGTIFIPFSRTLRA